MNFGARFKMRLTGARRLLRSRFFPSYFSPCADFKFSAFIGLGGNIGDTKRRFSKFIRVLQDDRRFNVVECSPILENAAFGYVLQKDFSNAVVNLQTSLSANKLLKIMQHYERKFKRVRSFKNAPRTLDLDILYFSGRARKDKRLTLPHPGAQQRISVIVPMGLMAI